MCVARPTDKAQLGKNDLILPSSILRVCESLLGRHSFLRVAVAGLTDGLTDGRVGWVVATRGDSAVAAYKQGTEQVLAMLVPAPTVC